MRSQPLLLIIVALLGLVVLQDNLSANHPVSASTPQLTTMEISTGLGNFMDIPAEALVMSEPSIVSLIRLTDSSVISVTLSLPEGPKKVDWKKLVQYAGADESLSNVVQEAYLISGADWASTEFKDSKPLEWDVVAAAILHSYQPQGSGVSGYSQAAELFPVSTNDSLNGRTISLKAEACQRGVESLATNPSVKKIAPDAKPETIATSQTCGVGPFDVFAGHFAPGEALAQMANKNVWTDTRNIVLAFNILGMRGLLPTDDPDVVRSSSDLKSAWDKIQAEIKAEAQRLASLGGSGGFVRHEPLSDACNALGIPAVSGHWVRGMFPGHTGVDWGANRGLPVPTTISGTVIHAKWNTDGYGNLVIVSRDDGTKTYYAHLSAFSVKYGDSVKVGDVIGEIGTTGNSTGNHLHYEVRVGWNAINPVGDQSLSLTCR